MKSTKEFDQQAVSIKQVLTEHADAVDFGDFGDGWSEEWIRKAEIRLQVVFPSAYRWWLKNYGGGSIYGDEIYSIYEWEYGTVPAALPAGDVVWQNELERMRWQRPATHLLFHRNDQAESYFFDLTAMDQVEAPVYVSVGDTTIRYADNFFDFLLRKLAEG